jgi:hypothetical protein
MNKPGKWTNAVVSEPCPLARWGNYGSWAVVPVSIARNCSMRAPEEFWRSMLLLQAQETSVYLLGAKVYERSSKNQSLRERIGQIGALETNWDGDGAPAIDPLIVQSALRVLDALPPPLQAEVSPNTNGTISFYLNTDNRYAELEIGLTRYGWTSFRNGNRQATAARSGSVDEIPHGDGIVSLMDELQEEAASLLKMLKAPLPAMREESMAGGGVRFNAPGLPALAAR